MAKVKITEGALRNMVKESVKKVLNEEPALALNYYDIETPMTLNQKMSLNEMSQINCEEMRNDKKSALNCNCFYVYVKGEGGYQKFPHFHIRHLGEGWDIRLNLDGTLHSVKVPSKSRKNIDDFRDIEKIAIKWVKQPNALESDRTNGQVAEITWKRNNN